MVIQVVRDIGWGDKVLLREGTLCRVADEGGDVATNSWDVIDGALVAAGTALWVEDHHGGRVALQEDDYVVLGPFPATVG